MDAEPVLVGYLKIVQHPEHVRSPSSAIFSRTLVAVSNGLLKQRLCILDQC